MAEILTALSLATDLGAGKPMGHAIRACYLGLKIADQLLMPPGEQAELYYSFLLMHSGCTVLSLELAPAMLGDEIAAIGDITLQDDGDPRVMLEWIWRNVSPGAPIPRRIWNWANFLAHSYEASNSQRGACEVAVQVAERLGMPPGVQLALQYYLERWDGHGPYGLSGSRIPLKACLLQLALKTEAITTALGRVQAERAVLQYKGKIFNPQVVDAFLDVSNHTDLWQVMEKGDLHEQVLNLEPDSPYRYIEAARLDEIALAVADFVDLKSHRTINHSRETARIAENIACRLGLSPAEITDVRRAALMHDLGLVALPGRLLDPRGPLSEADQEKLHLHPYYTERILARVPAFASIASIAGMHHERLNGTGYYRGLSGNELPLSACILALADEFQERCQNASVRNAADPKAVLEAMQPEVGKSLSPECYQALAQELGAAAPKSTRRREWPAGLTGREVEILKLVATGSSNRQIAQSLVISEKTVAHHLEHIYNKIGISSRAAAVFFAMEHELIQ